MHYLYTELYSVHTKARHDYLFYYYILLNYIEQRERRTLLIIPTDFVRLLDTGHEAPDGFYLQNIEEIHYIRCDIFIIHTIHYFLYSTRNPVEMIIICSSLPSPFPFFI